MTSISGPHRDICNAAPENHGENTEPAIQDAKSTSSPGKIAVLVGPQNDITPFLSQNCELMAYHTHSTNRLRSYVYNYVMFTSLSTVDSVREAENKV